MVHDGSYMSKVDRTICTTYFMIKCTATAGHKAIGTVVDKSDFAGNYQAEGQDILVLGGFLSSVQLK